MSAVLAGEVVQLSPLVRRITANNPGAMTGAGTNCYLIGREEMVILDPGPADPAHIEAILAAVGAAKVRWIVVTHTHPDHSPAAALLAAKTGAEMVGCVLADDGHQDKSFRVDGNVRHGDLIVGREFTLEAIATPGHVANHFCFLLREEGQVFTGDHIMGGSTVVIIPPSGDMAEYLDSLERLKGYPVKQLLPGHGNVIEDPIGVINGLIAHRLRREDKVIRVLRAHGDISLVDLTPLVYDDVDVSLHLVAQVSLWAHLLKLEKEGRAIKMIEQHWLFGQQRWRMV
ncbi:MAG TPA: MBL fold metallo-hydrolase [Pseudomonadales bacterium]|nr:MBL fold metallo-hydrolase [Pseudomonadales bacterium]